MENELIVVLVRYNYRYVKAKIVHGFISPFVLVAKLFGANIGLYAENNTGSLYWLGFILGVVLLLGGGGGYATRRRWYD